MVVPMVIIMSLYGAVEASIRMGDFSNVLFIWLTNTKKFCNGITIPVNYCKGLVKEKYLEQYSLKEKISKNYFYKNESFL